MSPDDGGSSAELPRSLINPGGESFALELVSLERLLTVLANPERKRYRDTNATAISVHTADRLLIVAGPGSGKSFLFLSRIQHWLPRDAEATVYVSSFVRKLVKDLQAEVEQQLSEDDQERVTVTTLHGLARSLLERSQGTLEQPLNRHINVITGRWQSVVWSDVREFHSELTSRHSYRGLDGQFHTENYDDDQTWRELRWTYFVLCQFYNAIGFADMVVLAREAVEENPELNSHLYWIIDEFQDFNASEDHLIRSLTATAKGVLLAGDDEQALYQQLKASLPEIIISYYDSSRFANAMLPYCSRCSYYVCLAASAFIANGRPEGSIEKIYLPLTINPDAEKLKVVATATPGSAVHYIQKFVHDHQSQLDEHIAKMEAGNETDPFLLVLTPQREARFFRTKKADQVLKEWLAQWTAVDTGHSEDYRRLATYCAVNRNPLDNFALRRVLDYQGATAREVHPLLEQALSAGCSLSDLDDPMIEEAVDRCVTVAGLVDDDDLSTEQKVGAISVVISIAEPRQLVQELDVSPLTGSIFGVDEEAEEAIQTAGAPAAIGMMTMVGSKGLSAKHVIVIGCDDVNLAKTSRLTFFVALTRARESLHLITSAKAGGAKCAHGYVQELPEEYCNYIVYKKTRSEMEHFGTRAAWSQRIDSWQWVARNRS